jgi:hypothetical protein
LVQPSEFFEKLKQRFERDKIPVAIAQAIT